MISCEQQKQLQGMTHKRNQVKEAISAKQMRWHKLSFSIAVERAQKKRRLAFRFSSSWTGADERRYHAAHAELAPLFEADIARLEAKLKRQGEAIRSFAAKYRINNIDDI